MPPIIALYQSFGIDVINIVLYMTRTFAYGLHRRKQILIGRWPYSTKNPDCTSSDIVFHLPYSVAGSQAERQTQDDSQRNKPCIINKTRATRPVSGSSFGGVLRMPYAKNIPNRQYVGRSTGVVRGGSTGGVGGLTVGGASGITVG